MTPLTPFRQHLLDWKNCDKCELSQERKKLVFSRGTIPCYVLFIGEAPGDSENLLGVPFIGPAGNLLDEIINLSIPKEITKAFTNLVCCIPRNEETRKADAPPTKAIKACSPRLLEFIRIAQPKIIVRVGALAKKYVPPSSEIEPDWLDSNEELEFCDIIHPAAILKGNNSQRGLLVQRSAAQLRTAVYLSLKKKQE